MKKDGTINLTSGQKVKCIRKLEGLTQEELALLIPSRKRDAETSVQKISNLENDRCRLTEDMAQKIVDAFPGKGYRAAWLLGYDDFMTEQELSGFISSQSLASSLQAAGMLHDVIGAFTGLAKLYGVEFTVPENEVFQIMQPLPAVARYKGQEFNAVELLRIFCKVFDILGNELDYAAETKAGDFSILRMLSEAKAAESMKKTADLLQTK